MVAAKYSIAVGALWALALAGCVSEGARAPEEPSAAPPNIVLITIDTQRADSLGAYGNEGKHTPNIDRLAAKGTVFERATSPVGTTFPSHATLLTGLNPRRHGVRYNGDRLAEDVVTLAEILREAGYETIALVTYGSMVSRGGLGQGFVRTSHERDGKPSHSTPPARITGMARGLLGRARPKPFLMWVHYYHPHSPYDLTEHAKEHLEGYDGPFKDGASVDAFYRLKKKRVSKEDRKALRALYDGETSVADEAVGAIVDTLEKTGLARNTIVVVTSDHGELLGEHGDIGHGPRLWEPVLHVPLVIYDPRNEEARRVATRVGLVDVTPTLLDLVGLSAPEGVDGRSVAPAMRGGELPERPYFGEVAALAPSQKEKDQTRDEAAIAVYLGDDKLILQDGQTRFYDLAEDPHERSGIEGDARTDRARRLQSLATEYTSQHGRTDGQVDPANLSPRVEEELRALGYVE